MLQTGKIDNKNIPMENIRYKKTAIILLS